MTDPVPAPAFDTDEILRAIGREVRSARVAAQWCAVCALAVVVLVALFLLGVVTIEFRPVR